MTGQLSTLPLPLLDFVYDFILTQLITEPTHEKGNILDQVLVSSPEKVSLPTVYPRDALPISSDHNLISFSASFSLSVVRHHKSPSCLYDFSRADWEGLLNHLMDFDFSLVYSCFDVNRAWFHLKEAACDLYIPKIYTKSKQHPPWFTHKICHHLNRRKCRCSSSHSLARNLFSSELALEEMMVEAKVAYE